jgi:hypothetical protein
VIAPKITIARKSGAKAALAHLLKVTKYAAYVGIPATTRADRSEQLLRLAGVKTGQKAKKLRKAAKEDVNNAELLFIFSKGSPIRGQEPRPVLEPAMAAQDNAAIISREIGGSIKAFADGDDAKGVLGMQRAALAGQNAARKWFTDPRNNWKPNALSTIRAKGSDKPGIDTGAMRAAIQGIVGEE